MEKEQSKKTAKSNRSPPYALFNLLVIVVAVIYGAYYQMYLRKDATQSEQIVTENEEVKIQLFTSEELKKYDGVSKSIERESMTLTKSSCTLLSISLNYLNPT